MNILQLLNEGNGIVLNEVEVIKDYGVKTGQTPHRAIHAKDSSGSTFIKIWGPESSKAFNPGEKFTIQAQGSDGQISVSEYNGKKSLNCNNCQVISANGGGAGTPPPQQQAPATQKANTGGGTRLSAEQLADAQAAHFARIVKRLQGPASEIGADPNTIVMAAAQMTGSASDWWFGEKYPS